MNLAWLSEFLRLTARVYAAIAITSATVLLAPDSALATIGLAEVRRNYRAWFGMALLGSAALLVTELSHQVWLRHSAKRVARSAKLTAADNDARAAEEVRARRVERLASLTIDEKAILRPYVDANVRSRAIPQNSGALHSLMNYQILGANRQSSTFDTRQDDYVIEVYILPWAMEHLRAHPELLE